MYTAFGVIDKELPDVCLGVFERIAQACDAIRRALRAGFAQGYIKRGHRLLGYLSAECRLTREFMRKYDGKCTAPDGGEGIWWEPLWPGCADLNP